MGAELAITKRKIKDKEFQSSNSYLETGFSDVGVVGMEWKVYLTGVWVGDSDFVM